MNTNLQNAIIEAGITTIEFTSNGRTITKLVSESPDSSLLKLLASGRRAFNDAVNGSPDKAKMSDAWMEKWDSGIWGVRAAAATETPTDKAWKEVARETLKSAGMKADAVKAAIKECGARGILQRLAMAQPTDTGATGPTAVAEDMMLQFADKVSALVDARANPVPKFVLPI